MNRLHCMSIYIRASLRMWRSHAQMGGVSIKRFTSVADLLHEITPHVFRGLRWLTMSVEYHFSSLNYAPLLFQTYVCKKSCAETSAILLKHLRYASHNEIQLINGFLLYNKVGIYNFVFFYYISICSIFYIYIYLLYTSYLVLHKYFFK